MAQRSLATLSPFVKSISQAETVQNHVQKSFHGMMSDVPASGLPDGYSARNININDYGNYAEVRAGSRIYTGASHPVGTFNGVCSHQKAGVVIKVYGSNVYLCDKGMEGYAQVLNISGVTLTGLCKIVEYNEDALLFNSAGIFLIVLSDYFYYMRMMNEPPPTSLISDIPEQFGSSDTSMNPYGYQYTYSMLQKKGNGAGDWNRLTPGAPPAFESGTCQSDLTGKDYGQCFFVHETGLPVDQGGGHFLSPTTFQNVITGLQVPNGVCDVTHFGIYRTLNIGQNSVPPGSGVSADSLGNNAALMVWCDDIPVAKAFIANQSGHTLTALQGTFAEEDVGSYISQGSAFTPIMITDVLNENQATVSSSATLTLSQINLAIGGGRTFTVYQSGLIINIVSFGDIFLPTDAGKPIFLANGQIIWIAQYVSSSQVVAAFPQSIATQGATMCPASGNFSRNYRDMQIDNVPQQGTGQLGLIDRASSGQSLYFPKRFYSALPGGETGLVDKGFLYVAKRDDTTWQYSDIGDKPYMCGYYRVDSQSERVETHIKQLLAINGSLAIIMASKTRSANPGVAADIGNKQVGESVFVIPSSQICDNAIGVIAWQTIVFKGNGLIYAITNEPAVKTFDGTAWSTTNLAKDCVQKDIESIDLNQPIVAVYIPGKYGGYKVWFKTYKLLIT
jgi:hypothetical protein